MVPMLPLHLPGNKQLMQTKMSSFSLLLLILQHCPYCGFSTQHGAIDLLKTGHYSTVAHAGPFRSNCVLCPLLLSLTSACCLITKSTCTLTHSVRFIASSSEKLYGTEHLFPGSVLVSKKLREAVYNGSVALPSGTLSSLSKVRLVSRVHHFSH